ncbi:MAG: hypothetical protein JOZ17_23675 [Acetobacteraceae bacterium]|nr:hypothetical protein [Acetobacteraceae bacterium]
MVAVRVFALSCLELQALVFSDVMLGEGRESMTLLGGALKEVVDGRPAPAMTRDRLGND